jgi:hypothetical protein
MFWIQSSGDFCPGGRIWLGIEPPLPDEIRLGNQRGTLRSSSWLSADCADTLDALTTLDIFYIRLLLGCCSRLRSYLLCAFALKISFEITIKLLPVQILSQNLSHKLRATGSLDLDLTLQLFEQLGWQSENEVLCDFLNHDKPMISQMISLSRLFSSILLNSEVSVIHGTRIHKFGRARTISNSP